MRKTAFITGATGGIGQQIARKLAKENYQLILHYFQNEQNAANLYDELSQETDVLLIRANFSTEEGIYQVLQSMPVKPDVFIYNAGKAHYGLLSEMDSSTYHQLLTLHLTAPFKLTQALYPNMIRKGWGRIIMMGSIWGEAGAACEVLYATLKGGIHAFVKALAKETAMSGITVNAISPGAINTQILPELSEVEMRLLTEQIPMGRLGHPDEVAHAVHFLTQAESSYITGQILRVNGGWYM
jgi:3-oxoacyl-[acyl-carrier protein] reductase